MSPPTCPECQTPVPAAVVNGPPITAYRCPGCGMTITWRNGRAIASKSRILPPLPEPRAAKPAVADSAARTELVPSPLPQAPGAAPAGAPAPAAREPLGGPAATDVTAPLPAQPEQATPAGPSAVPLGEAEVPVSSGAALGFPRGEEPPRPLPTPSPTRRPPLKPALAALGALVLAALGWAVFARGGGEPARDDAPSLSLRDDAPAPPDPADDAPKPAPETPPKPAPDTAVKPPDPAPKPPDPAVKAPGPGPKPPDAPKPAAPAGPKLGGKRVVLEYDKGPEGGETLPPEIAADVQRARNLYQQGNAKLFGGDAKAAVPLYEQSLKAYPGYVGAYRGLGLAWSAQKESARALAAFRTYAKNAPGAKDAALIKKVIAKLEAEVAAAKK